MDIRFKVNNDNLRLVSPYKVLVSGNQNTYTCHFDITTGIPGALTWYATFCIKGETPYTVPINSATKTCIIPIQVLTTETNQLNMSVYATDTAEILNPDDEENIILSTNSLLFKVVRGGYELAEESIEVVPTKYAVMPSATSLTGRIVQFVGTTTTTAPIYINGYFYKSNGTVWERVDVQPNIDVKVNGTSVVDENGVANIDLSDMEEKLDSIEEGAQKNVNADWDSISGDSVIENKPHIYTEKKSGGSSDITYIGQNKTFDGVNVEGNTLYAGGIETKRIILYADSEQSTSPADIRFSEYGESKNLQDYLDEKIDRINPTGTGALSVNRKSGTETGENSATMGTDCEASAKNAVSMGNGCEASNNSAVASGTGSKAKGKYSYAGGLESEATAQGSFTHGQRVKATGVLSVAFGYNESDTDIENSKGAYSFTMGKNSTATNNFGTAIGEGLEASSYAQLAIGRFNEKGGKNVAFSIGKGLRDDYRKDAFRIFTKNKSETKDDGAIFDLWIDGDVTAGGTYESPNHKLSETMVATGNGGQSNKLSTVEAVNAAYESGAYQIYLNSGQMLGNGCPLRFGEMIVARWLDGSNQDFGAQIIFPNGDDDADKKNCFWYRTHNGDTANGHTATWNDWIKVEPSNYVQKESGKGLSTEDYTTAEKNKLAGIAEGAEVNAVSDVQVDGVSVIDNDGVAEIDLSDKEDLSNKVTSITSLSTDTEYASAKCVYGELQAKSDKTSIKTSTDVEAQILQPLNNTEYRFSVEMVSLGFGIPTSHQDDHIFSVVFNSGSVATDIEYSDSIIWTGDDLTEGRFVPKANRRYTIVVWYDGVWNGITRGVDYELS